VQPSASFPISCASLGFTPVAENFSTMLFIPPWLICRAVMVDASHRAMEAQRGCFRLEHWRRQLRTLFSFSFFLFPLA
jgi:hypothetical protein